MSSVVEPVASFPNSLAVRANVVHEAKPYARQFGADSDSRLWQVKLGGPANAGASSDQDDRERCFILGEG